MRTHTKIALAFAALAAISGCKNDENKTENTANPEDYVYTQPRSNYDSRPDPYNAKFLIHAENVPLQRAGIDFTATISGYCDSFDQSDLDAYTAACTDYLTQKIQSDALNHHFFTAAKLSTDPAFIKAGLTSKPEYHDEAVARRLFTAERIQQKVERGTDNFYIIEGVSDLETADITLGMD